MEIKAIQRDANGLIIGLEHLIKEDGYVDWRNMVPVDQLYINPQRKEQIEKKYSKPFAEINIKEDNVADSDLVITLAGIKYLLKIRGFTALNYDIHQASSTYAAVKCGIVFRPNFETEGVEVFFSDNACAHAGNTKSFGVQYLLEIASNRALCRAVRNFLNINIVSKEELGDVDFRSGDSRAGDFNPTPSPELLIPTLKDQMIKNGYTFDQIKAKIVKQEPKAEEWNKIEDLPSKWLLWCIDRIDQKLKVMKTD